MKALKVIYHPNNDGNKFRTVQEKLGDLLHVADLGASPSASAAINTAYIQEAIDAASDAGGGDVYLGVGTYSVTGLVIKTGVRLRGQGIGATILELEDASDADVISSEDFYTLTGNNSSSSTTPHDFAIMDMTIDGNSANQSPGDPDECNGLALYAYRYTLENVLLQDLTGHGMRLEWGSSGNFQMGATYSNIIIDTCGRHGVWFKGPHDSDAFKIHIVDAGQEADDTYSAFYNDANGGAKISHFHGWHRAAVTNRCEYILNIESGSNKCEISDSDIEGGRKQVRLANARCKLSTCSIYAPFSDEAQIVLDNDSIEIQGCSFHSNASFPNPIVLEIGQSTGVSEYQIDMTINVASTGTTNEVVKFTDDDGGWINVRSTGCGHSSLTSGTPDNDTRGQITQAFPTTPVPLERRFGPTEAFILDQSWVAVSHTANTNETALATISIPAGAMGLNGSVEVIALCSNNSSANNHTFRIRFGGIGGTIYASGVNTTNIQFKFHQTIGNRNAANSQVGNLIIGDDGWGATSSAFQTSAVDTSAAVNLVISGQLAATGGGETVTLEGYIVKLHYKA